MARQVMEVRYATTCADCGTALPAGAWGRYYGPGRMYGVDCHPQRNGQKPYKGNLGVRFDFQPFEKEAISWAKDRLGPHWRARLCRDYELSKENERFNDHPFGYPTWNARFQLARFLLRNGNGSKPGENTPSADTSVERIQHDIYGDLNAPAHRNGAAPDLSVLAFIGETAEHMKVWECLTPSPSQRKAVDTQFAAKMNRRFQRPDVPYTAIFSPLMRDKIEAEIARIRTGKKMRRNPGRQSFGYQWNLVDTATAQHPDHPWGASYCKKCQPYSLKRMHTIADRAQGCIDGGISREPLPEEAFAWRRALDAKQAETMRRWNEKDQAGILPKGRAA